MQTNTIQTIKCKESIPSCLQKDLDKILFVPKIILKPDSTCLLGSPDFASRDAESRTF